MARLYTYTPICMQSIDYIHIPLCLYSTLDIVPYNVKDILSIIVIVIHILNVSGFHMGVLCIEQHSQLTK